MPQSDFSKYRLLAPGPVPLSEKVKEALSLPMIHHRTPEFEEVFLECLENLKWIFQTQQPVMILPTTGSGGMEAALCNTLSPGDEILVIVSGKFGERWKKMAEIYGIKAEAFNVGWGETLNLSSLEKKLSEKQYAAVLSQVSETSTATVHPIREMALLHKKYQKGLFILDAISALGCMPLPMDEWGLDVVVAGSQKAFALPTGLSFIALSERAWEANKTARCPRFYLDVKKEKEANDKGQTHFSSSVLLVRALQAVLREFKTLGLDQLIAEIQSRAVATREAVENLGLKVYSSSPSPSVTAVSLPEDVDGAKLRTHIEKTYNVTFMGGQDQLKGRIIRIGHMGFIDTEDILASVEALGLGLRDLDKNKVTMAQIEQAMDNLKKSFS